MMTHSANHANISLPLLIDYVDALLSTLTSTDRTQPPADNHALAHNAPMLWIVTNKAEKQSLYRILQHQRSVALDSQDSHSSDEPHTHDPSMSEDTVNEDTINKESINEKSINENTVNKDIANEKSMTLAQIMTLTAIIQSPQLDRFELACFWLPSLTEEMLRQYIPVIMRYRDLYAAHLLIAIDSGIDLKAYGFVPLDVIENINNSKPSIKDHQTPASSPLKLTLWQFNLYDYKQLPNWLNADYWANPDNWNKYRW